MNRIIIYIPSFESGGAERAAAVLINHWVKKYDIALINTMPVETDFFEIDPSIERTILPFQYNKSVSFIFERFQRILALRRATLKYQDGIFISFLSQPSILFLIATIGLKKKIICCEHNNYYALQSISLRLLRNILYFLFPQSITLLTYRDIQNYPKRIQKKVIVMENPLGVDGRSLATKKTDCSLVRMLFVGRLTKQKGIDRLCKIISMIPGNNWIIDICGDGELKDELITFIENHRLTEKVFYHGNVKNISTYYTHADVLLMTSYWEGLPMVIAESMSFGVPVISFDCPTGPKEFIRHRENGMLIKDGDLKSYICHLNEIISDNQLRSNFSAHAKRTADAYGIEKISQKWDDIFNSCNF